MKFLVAAFFVSILLATSCKNTGGASSGVPPPISTMATPTPVIFGFEDSPGDPKGFDWGKDLATERKVPLPDIKGIANQFSQSFSATPTPVPGIGGFFQRKVPGVKGTLDVAKGVLDWMPVILFIAVILFVISLPGKIVGGIFGIVPKILKFLFTRRRKTT